MTMSKVSTKTDPTQASSPRGSLPPVSPGPVRSDTTFGAHLKNANQEPDSGTPQDGADTHDAASPPSQPPSTRPTSRHARHAATQDAAAPPADDPVASQTVQAVASPPGPSTANRTTKTLSAPKAGDATAPDQTSQSLLADVLSQTIGLQQSLPPASPPQSDDTGAPAIQPNPAAASISPPTDTGILTAAASQTTPTNMPPASPLPSTGTATAASQNPPTPAATQAPNAQPIPVTLSPQSATAPASGQPATASAATQAPGGQPIPAAPSPQSATASAASQPTITPATAQAPGGQPISITLSPQPSATTAPASNQPTVQIAATQASLVSHASSSADMATIPDQATPQVAATQAPTSQPVPATTPPQLPTGAATAVPHSSLQAAATTAGDHGHASHATASVPQDPATDALSLSPAPGVAAPQQSASASQSAQPRSPIAAALPHPADALAPATSGGTPSPDSADGSLAQGNGLTAMAGHPDSANTDRDETNAQANPRTASVLDPALGLAPSGTFATTLNNTLSETRADPSQKPASASHETDGHITSSPITTQSVDGSTSLSMTILTDDSTPVHVRLDGTDGQTTNVILQSEDQATARHLADNRHDLVAALGAAGVDVSNLKIDVVAASSGNSNDFQNQGQGQNADGTAFGGNFSGGMFGGGPGQNGQQSYGGNLWNANTAFPGQGTGDIEAQKSVRSARSSDSQAGSGVNITA
ncbi:flagellar hook-length control protein FliK [Gluconacetobacter sacchari]|uniref:Flagellar hook-length control protein FliK n=3 Tax=Gluconacetobacter sacchari TaxID=92759 RepID=A0A7W4NJ13_9PROT|nr:flagellar hook-length control protein FliK [Gluconacetobacter sacchari]MBB2158652.1 hypothetical protein [Gluconacetobacter sacchari]